jgi:hypothetical protein
MDAADRDRWSRAATLRDLADEAARRGIAGPVHHCFHCGLTGSPAEVPFSSSYRTWDNAHNGRTVRIGVCERCERVLAHYGTE